MMAKAADRVSPRWASKVLEIHERTARDWCRKGKFSTAKWNPATRRYTIDKSEVDRVAAYGFNDSNDE